MEYIGYNIGELKETYTTEYIVNQIRLSLSTPQKKIWVVVEGEDDVAFYNKVMVNSLYSVHNSNWSKDTNTNPSKSCANVECIVREVLESDAYFKDYVIGIRDKDFTPWIEDYSKPDNIYLTDTHSIETQILSDKEVQDKLELLPNHDNFKLNLLECRDLAEDFATVRIHNARTKSGISMDKALSLDKLIEEGKNPKQPWPKIIIDLFNSLEPGKPRKVLATKKTCSRVDLTSENFDKIKSELPQESEWCRVQGHDVVRLLHARDAFGSGHVTKENVWQEMLNAYTKEMFQRTKLYADIETWRNNRKVS